MSTQPIVGMSNITNAEELLKRLGEGDSLLFNVLKNKPLSYISKLLDTKTPYGSSFLHIAATGLFDPNDPIGLYVDGSKTYTDPVFGPLLDEIIALYHGFNKTTQKHITDFDISGLQLTDLNVGSTEGCSVLSMRVRYAFCIDSYPFQSAMTREQRNAAEKEIISAMNYFPKELQGTYESLEVMSVERKQQLILEHFLSPTDEDARLVNSGIASDWPYGRGIFLSNDKEVFILVNDEDNRLGVLQQGGNIASTFNKLATVDKILRTHLSYATSPIYGNLVSCPTNIGTGMRLSALVTLPNLCQRQDFLKKVANKFGLAIRGHYGEHSKVGDRGEVDVSNKARLGISEVEIVKQVYEGVSFLMNLEKKIEKQPINIDNIIQETDVI